MINKRPFPLFPRKETPKRAGMQMQVEQSAPDQVRFRLEGKLVLDECPRIRQTVLEQLRPEIRTITLDLSGVPFMDSAGLGLLVGLYQNLKKNGCTLALDGVHSGIRPIFQITGMDEIFGLPAAE